MLTNKWPNNQIDSWTKTITRWSILIQYMPHKILRTNPQKDTLWTHPNPNFKNISTLETPHNLFQVITSISKKITIFLLIIKAIYLSFKDRNPQKLLISKISINKHNIRPYLSFLNNKKWWANHLNHHWVSFVNQLLGLQKH